MKTKISYNELLYIGYLLEAEYLDFNYYSAIDDIDTEKDVLFSNAETSLIEKGLLEQDFSGNTMINTEFEKMLNPIFFSTKESEIDVLSKAEKTEDDNQYNIIKFHYSDDSITQCTLGDDEVTIEYFEDFDFLIKNTDLTKLDLTDETLSEDEFEEDKLKRMIIVKNVDGDMSAFSVTFVLSDSLFKINDSGEFSSVSNKEFAETIKDVLVF